MVTRSSEFGTLDQLREYVNRTLCQYDQLVEDAFPLTEHVLIRAGEPCGMYFCIHGPRSVKFSAIWETDTNSVYFYASTGERFQHTTLISAPRIEAAMN